MANRFVARWQISRDWQAWLKQSLLRLSPIPWFSSVRSSHLTVHILFASISGTIGSILHQQIPIAWARPPSVLPQKPKNDGRCTALPRVR